MPRSGSQCWLCDLPVRFDTYKGCTHGCAYCFVRRKLDISDIEIGETASSLLKFIQGKRTGDVSWVDWDIPIHWGGVSDPFQPCEKKYRVSYDCLKVFEKTQYPFIVSTKGALAGDDEYVDLLSKCNCVVQISAVCDSYNKYEPGCPTYRERLEIAKKIASTGKRVIIRIQPYEHQFFDEIKNNLKDVAATGAYGVVIEGMKYLKKRPGLVKVCGDWCYSYQLIKDDFLALKEEGHKHGLKVYAGENRIRELGDSLTCCGIDGLEGFVPNKFNINHFVQGEFCKPTKGQLAPGSARVFASTNQTYEFNQRIKDKSFAQVMAYFAKEKADTVKECFGLNEK